MDGSKQPNSDSPTATDNPGAARPRRRKPAGGVKETIESILIAFILAFVFRAFVVEAFVIPTGSMATTLMGAHMNFTCTDCGYKWRVNYSAQTNAAGDDLVIPDRPPGVMVDVVDPLTGRRKRELQERAFYLACPNCGFRVPKDNAADPENDATSPRIDYGDRILVLKYLYQLTDPQRWDVVVFKSPTDAPRYQLNYIKRLVGKPGEQIMVLDGDIYVGGKGEPTDKFRVQTKPHHAQEALWRIVYDNDFQPVNARQPRNVTLTDGTIAEDPTWKQPWVQQPGGSGWTTGSAAVGDRAMRFDNLAGSSKLSFEPVSGSVNYPLTNWLAYNITMDQSGVNAFDRPPPSDPMLPHVSDLKLKLFYQRTAGDGPLRLELTKNDDAFVAEFTPGSVRLLRYTDHAETVLGQVQWTAPGRPAEIEFTNVDYRVSIRIDGEEILATTPQQYAPNVAELLAEHYASKPRQRPKASITAAKQVATLQHVSLWRDVYYTNRQGGKSLPWGTPEDPIALGADEFFVLGDNSSNSLDARFWTHGIKLEFEELDVEAGRVPARFMLGKAFFVYWPAGLKLFGRWGLVPNVGEMRFIH